MKKTLFAIVAGAGAFVAVNALAEHHEASKGEGDMEAKMAAHFAEMDGNSDGNITREEFLAYQAKKAEKHWAKMAEGAGDDGMISMDEMKAIHQAHMKKMHEKHGMMPGKGTPEGDE